ncbi:MAG: hypothetical protein KJZ47_08725, partial [Gemmatimonadales bacterium]|nr:hypothetical protein [Gemmatimonadales bacterium]
VTAHTLPLLFGVEVAAVQGSAPAAGAPITAVAEPRYTVAGLSDGAGKRIGIYKSWAASMDEGWTRWMFDANRIRFTSLHDREVRAGNLGSRFDVIIMPDQSPNQIARGLGRTAPDSLQGGLGEEGAAALKAFVEGGGTILFFNDASDYGIDILDLPVRNATAGVARTELYAPGSLLGVEVDRSHPIAARHTAPVPVVWFENSPTFEVTDPARARVVARYQASGDPLRSGWLLGGEKLNGKAALVEVTVGRGKVVLFGFQPQYRGQTMTTQSFIWDAIGRTLTP